MTSHLIVLSTLPDQKTAVRIAEELLRERLAACVTVSPETRSFYWWQGEISREKEFMLIIKTTTARYDDLEIFLRERHPYEVPEIAALPILKGHAAYLDWMVRETTPD